MGIKVMLDAGHSSNVAVGARGNGLKEEVVVLDIALKVGELLSKNGIDVLYTRKNGNAMAGCYTNATDLKSRCLFANNNKVNYYVSIHNNSATSTSASGIETLYNTRYSDSLLLATNIQNQLIEDTDMKNRGLKVRTDLAVLNNTNMPSCLIEVGFLSNVSDANQLKKTEFIDSISESIAKGICKTCGVIYKDTSVKIDTELENAITTLEKKGIVLKKDVWKSVDVIKLSNVPSLLMKLGGIDHLASKKIIGQVDMWRNGTYETKHVRALLIKCANML